MRAPLTRPSHSASGFTLIELLVVVALIGLGAAVVTLAMRDPSASRLEQEAARLSALLENARAESRASGVPVGWVPHRPSLTSSANEPDFKFTGLPASRALPNRWLGPGVVAEVKDAQGLVLGPEPIIAPQQVTLRLDRLELTLRTDGLGPFTVASPDEAPLPQK